MPSPNESSDETESQSESVEWTTTFDPEIERPSEAIVTAVAAVLETDPLELSPLSDSVEPDALDSLVEHAQQKVGAGAHEVWISYEGVDVGVRSDGRIRTRDATVAT
nr:HalOD1 output domain-containing protein [Natrinema gelatinilyticum]